MEYNNVIYKWYNRRGELVRICDTEQSKEALLKNRERTIETYMKTRGLSREEAKARFGTIVKVDFSRREETTI